ncbi:Molybdenum cofactor guanylyltransferase [Candidatus Terasakiella magnetica]|uniref:Molybdenum cofactor guanylyltransferase n=1 Tax=Candidatus Terasakiella magnetica TaxID=1867952 RepID=A0A1C3RHT8_9PROT|nr:molybdenum cofactor guanylyltransferase MobA [Candidatus Terasakiella magnetica]SCA56837.1 Molybdenum cofactor guanylyltransferase [Candidatus Terasakiella magnetica]
MGNQIGCVLLAGGLARRMGGGDKGLKTVQGKPIIERVLETITPQVGPLVINANGDGARFAHLGHEVVGDSVEGFVGPLAGVLAGMDHLVGQCEWILSVPTDTPFLPDDLVTRLKEPLDEGNKIVMAHSGGFDHPVVALWSMDLREELRKALIEEEMRKLKQWIKRYPHASVEWETDPLDPFFNANRPEDIAGL